MTTKTEKTAGNKIAGTVTERINDVREVATGLGGALTESGKAYVSGVMALGKTLGMFGREALTEAGGHLRATMQAKCLREVAELQAAYAQQRVEMSATHAKELVDQARVKSEEMIAPLTALLKRAA
ncbi:phasin family protein [Paracoccus sp. (in: a-proteobacteria)]|uniref:phasin family protein n=1 Tax=Paracoccus sp. TaxID=267 RepID=UPI003A8BDF17